TSIVERLQHGRDSEKRTFCRTRIEIKGRRTDEVIVWESSAAESILVARNDALSYCCRLGLGSDGLVLLSLRSITAGILHWGGVSNSGRVRWPGEEQDGEFAEIVGRRQQEPRGCPTPRIVLPYSRS